MRKPNLFIIGAMKSGTSSLHAYLNDHPDIFMCPRKEPHYFVDKSELWKIWPELARKRWWSDDPAYLSLFSGATDEAIIGESSTGYTKLHRVTGVARRILEFNPDSRFIYVMRDPIERAISHYWHAVANDGEHRTLLKAIKADPHYVEVSDYAVQLAPYVDLFGKDRIFTTTMEELARNPAQVVKSIFEWLGVDAAYRPRNLDRVKNAAPATFQKATGFGALYRIRSSRAYDFVEGVVPRAVKEWARDRMTSTATQNDDERAACVQYLRPILQPKARSVEALCQRDFPEWKTLWGCAEQPGAARR